ncbi:hypothetical protein [Rhizobium leguminosarum]|uniref:hypothetical protein n=1 Tax=Rhizobium leguminosarum TaxID=384 RepID=UPI001F41F2E3|nr:hypothetical protein [Rhizobium leguminosarum]UIJ81748.1 hypothetical protein LZK78_10900 [Rhizobium leguminosarum]
MRPGFDHPAIKAVIAELSRDARTGSNRLTLRASVAERSLPYRVSGHAYRRQILPTVWDNLADRESVRVRKMGRALLQLDWVSHRVATVEIGPPLPEDVLAKSNSQSHPKPRPASAEAAEIRQAPPR